MSSIDIYNHDIIIKILFNQLHMAWGLIEASRGNELGCSRKECLEDMLFVLRGEQKDILKRIVGNCNENY